MMNGSESRKRWCALLASGLMLGSSIGGRGQEAAQPQPSAPLPYRLAAGDVVEVRHAFNPELNETAQIRPDGKLSLPMIGEVDFGGNTIQQATALLQERYAKDIRTPRIMIQVRGFAALKIFVTGEVLRPGLLNMPGPMTLYEAVNEAGGITRTGSKNIAMLIRKGPAGAAEGRKVSIYSRGRLGPDASLPLQPFDVVIVPETRIAKVDRWVDQYIRQLLPIHASAGFMYLMQKQPKETTTIPTFPIF